jgi:hypothetical protein
LSQLEDLESDDNTLQPSSPGTVHTTFVKSEHEGFQTYDSIERQRTALADTLKTLIDQSMSIHWPWKATAVARY